MWHAASTAPKQTPPHRQHQSKHALAHEKAPLVGRAREARHAGRPVGGQELHQQGLEPLPRLRLDVGRLPVGDCLAVEPLQGLYAEEGQHGAVHQRQGVPQAAARPRLVRLGQHRHLRTCGGRRGQEVGVAEKQCPAYEGRQCLTMLATYSSYGWLGWTLAIARLCPGGRGMINEGHDQRGGANRAPVPCTKNYVHHFLSLRVPLHSS
jgi:hypothetical protein